jgi:hypothetical protein
VDVSAAIVNWRVSRLLRTGIRTTNVILRLLVRSGFINIYPRRARRSTFCAFYFSGNALMKPFGCEWAALGSSTEIAGFHSYVASAQPSPAVRWYGRWSRVPKQTLSVKFSPVSSLTQEKFHSRHSSTAIPVRGVGFVVFRR